MFEESLHLKLIWEPLEGNFAEVEEINSDKYDEETEHAKGYSEMAQSNDAN